MRETITSGVIAKESPVSIGQRALWFVHQYYPDVGVYNVEYSWFVPDDLDERILEQSIHYLVQRHETLRTTFTLKDGHPIRRILEKWEPPLEIIDVGSADDMMINDHCITAEVRKPFDLSISPPKRYILFKRSKGKRVFSIILHHILMDLRTIMMWMNELRMVYGCFSKSLMPKLPEITATFDGYNLAQKAYLKSTKGQDDEAYWMNRLKDYSPNLEIPGDLKSSENNQCTTLYLSGVIPNKLANQYLEFGKSIGISPYELMFASYFLLLHKLTGKNSITLGTPSAGRSEEFGEIYGCFVNTILMNVDIDPTNSTQVALQALARSIREGLQHRDYPTPLLAEKLSYDRSDSSGTMFQGAFIWENANSFYNRDMPIVSWKDGCRYWNMNSMGVWDRVPRYQQIDDILLSFKIYKFKDSLHWGVEYNSDVVDKEFVEDLYESYEELIKGILAKPNIPFFQQSVLSESKAKWLLVHSQGTKSIYKPLTFIELFTNQAIESPDSVAVTYLHYEISYREINERANQLAHKLIEAGVGPNDIVGVSIKRSIDLIVGILGILKSGAAYLPLDRDYPKDRLKYIANDARVLAIIGDTDEVLSLYEREDCFKLLFSSSEVVSAYPVVEPDINRSIHDLAYVIYTSGSTGKPKGVQLAYKGLSAMIHAQQQTFNLEESNNILQFASINFDASVFEIVMALANGKTLHMSAKEQLLGEGLIQFVREKQINWCVLPPAILATLDPGKIENLKTVITAGDNCTREISSRWAEGRDFYNAYGPTEATVWSTITKLEPNSKITIGSAIPNTETFILDKYLQLVPVGVPGELYIGGDGLALGYLNRPDLTSERFILNPFVQEGNKRLYKTGDLVRFLSDGTIEFLGRIDHQVKIRGYRIELGEINENLLKHPAVHDSLVVARTDIAGASKEAPLLVAYVVRNASESLTVDQLRDHLKDELPDYMVPSAYSILDAFPLTPNGKVDTKALPIPERKVKKDRAHVQEPRNEIERILAETWEECLGIKHISISENFFDLGGHSLLMAQVYSKLPDIFREKLTIVDLFAYPTIQALAHFIEDDVEEDEFYLEQDDHAERLRLRRRLMESLSGVKVAIVGMSGRFPGADNVESYWKNLCEGKESITFFSKEQLRKAGVPEEVIANPSYVPAKGMLDSISGFDAPFFNFTPREAQITDPQQRLFLECAWEVLEDAGCVANKFQGSIGVFAGIGINQYLMTHLSTHPELLATVGDYPMMIGNDKDFLCTRVAYKLNLNGPAMVLQTACSTSLVAVHTACQSLLNEECDAAIAGGVSFNRLGKDGYFYHEGMIMSPDGHCRAFDKDAKGTVQGQGCGLVMLKRLDDALENNDHIYAVIVGSATNNDGSNKSGYTAPSVEGQANVINMALASANINPGKINYIEAHGTGTPIGDPIEIEGLRKAFQKDDLPSGSCAIGSVKTNIGHLDAASGVAGLIKVAKSIEARMLPPSLHYNNPNPKIDFSKTPFYVNNELKYWKDSILPRFAGISSFGIGGTNAHVILSESPSETRVETARPWRIVTLSARTRAALDSMTERFVSHLKKNKRQSFSNICYTLHVGRELFAFRRYLVCRNRDEAIQELAELNSKHVVTSRYIERSRKLVFMFSGQGSQYVNMGRHLYSVELTFRNTVDECRKMLSEKFVHLYEELSSADNSALTEKIHETWVTQPGLFIFEYALSKMLISWGIKPDYMIGHSIGEYVAACLSGVFTLEQALELVTIRGNLIQALESGNMLSINVSEDEALEFTNKNISLAAVNGAKRCVLSGDKDAIRELSQRLNVEGISNRILHTSHAFHSHMMEPILKRFKAYVARRSPQVPTKPFVSSSTGEFITEEQATSPQYWADHLRYEVRFHKGMSTIFGQRLASDVEAKNEQMICLEIGPGKALTTLATQHPEKQTQDLILATTRHAYEEISDTQHLLRVIAKLWEQGIDIDWDEFHSTRQRYRVPLPTYPFERKTYWVRPKVASGHVAESESTTEDIMQNEPLEHSEPIENAKAPYDPPKDHIEDKIWRHWRESLGSEDFGVHDNFFDIGGDSLIAVNLIDRLKNEFKIPLATHLLIRKPTVAELAEHIKSNKAIPTGQVIESGDEYECPLVLIQSGKPDVTPLIMVHPIGGEVFFYRDLAHHLGSDQPLYAFQAPGLSGVSEPISSVPDLAKLYLSELEKADFKPPFFIGGSSFGGLIAYEMAQQLSSNGILPGLVVMVDTPAPDQMPRHLTDSAAILDYLLSDDLDIDISHLRSFDEREQIDFVLEAARAQGKGNVLPPHLGVSLFKTWMAHQDATYKYEPKKLDCPIIYFRHTEPQEHFPPLPHLPWAKLTAQEFIVHQVPGNHVSMNYPPHVQVMATHLKLILRQAREKYAKTLQSKGEQEGTMLAESNQKEND
ncbi:MAG: amino acid adenylation domain-containing protein [Pseudomonadales bacterium]|nr:amino acid adenylation domain-containing protein [Pseudomonadales bacterium]